MINKLKDRLTLLNCIYCAFIFIEGVIYAVFNVLSATQPNDPVYLKYSGVLLCLVTAAAMIYFYKKDAIVLTCALVFTAVSDLFILVLDDYYEIGVTTFILTQSIYLYRLYDGRFKRIYITLAVRAVLAAITITILAVFSQMNYLVAAASIYFVMLVVNCADAFVLCGRGLKNVLFAVGLLLFIGCDICVGLHNFGSVLNVDLPRGLVIFVQYAIWAFYLPSQVCIVCSVKTGGLNGKGKKGESNEGIQTIQAA